MPASLGRRSIGLLPACQGWGGSLPGRFKVFLSLNLLPAPGHFELYEYRKTVCLCDHYCVMHVKEPAPLYGHTSLCTGKYSSTSATLVVSFNCLTNFAEPRYHTLTFLNLISWKPVSRENVIWNWNCGGTWKLDFELWKLGLEKNSKSSKFFFLLEFSVKRESNLSNFSNFMQKEIRNLRFVRTSCL